MKKIYFILFLFFSLKVFAEWTEISSSRESIYYIDLQTIERTSMVDLVSIWDYEVYPNGLTGSEIKSAINNLLIDCASSKVKYLYSFYFTDLNAKNLFDLYLLKDENWTDINKDSHFEKIKNKIC